MKYSDDSEEHRRANIGYANERWRQLYGLQNEWGTEGIKYLLFVNAGAAVAVLAFLGSVASARDMLWPKTMLGFFAVGIVLIGLLHATRYHRVENLFKQWRTLVNEYYTDQKGWGEINKADDASSAKFDWALLMAYVSFTCFIIGILIGMFNFSTLTSGENHGRKETTITSTSTQANSPTPTINNDRGIGGEARKKSDAKLPASGTNSKKEIIQQP